MERGLPVADQIRRGLMGLLDSRSQFAAEQCVLGKRPYQHPKPPQRHARAAPPKVAQINPTKRKIGLDRITVGTDQLDEAVDSPTSPKPIAAAILSDSGARSRAVRFIAFTVRH